MEISRVLYEMMGLVRTADPFLPQTEGLAQVRPAVASAKRSLSDIATAQSPGEVFASMENVVHQLGNIAKAAGDRDLANDFRSISADVSRAAKAFEAKPPK